jgi:hypothetical protein
MTLLSQWINVIDKGTYEAVIQVVQWSDRMLKRLNLNERKNEPTTTMIVLSL